MIPKNSAQLTTLLAHARKGDKGALAVLITLLESSAAAHRKLRTEAQKKILARSTTSMRIGISGLPGAGKSTLIEALGLMLCEKKRRVAVLSVDPTSPISGGSILGDKTRMANLSRHPLAYVRPSPSGGLLGGVAARTKDAVLACEWAGYEVIFVETVGVGQSESAVRSIVDCLLFVALTGGGDELQNMKRGLLELIDVVVVNKADGDNRIVAERVAIELKGALSLFPATIPDWQRPAIACSARDDRGTSETWEAIERFLSQLKKSVGVRRFRAAQDKDWFERMVRENLFDVFLRKKQSLRRYNELKQKIEKGVLSAPLALERLFK